MWRSLLSVLAPAWLGRMLVTMHLMELRCRSRGAGRGPGRLQLLIVHDRVECWAVACRGVRYRTLVL